MKKKYFKAAMKVLAIMITGALLSEVLFINTEASPLKTNEEEINETEAVAEETETAQPSAENTDESNEMMIPQPIPFMEHPIAEDAHEYYSEAYLSEIRLWPDTGPIPHTTRIHRYRRRHFLPYRVIHHGGR